MQDPHESGSDEQGRNFGLKSNCYEKAGARDRPLQPVLHAELREPITRVQDQGDHGGTHAVEDCRQDRQPAEVNVKRAKCGHYDEVRQDERPSARPRSPKAAAQIGDENSDLDRERSRKRLAYCYSVAHLVAAQPLPLLHELSLHLSAQCYWSAEAKRAEAQVVKNKVAKTDGGTRIGLH